MLDHTNTRLQILWKKFRNKEFRESFSESRVRTNIAAQVQTMRSDRQLTQDDLAELAGMAQSRISLIEDPSYERMTISTLNRIASAFDVALSIKFVPHSVLLKDSVKDKSTSFSVSSFDEDTLPTSSSLGWSASATTYDGLNQSTHYYKVSGGESSIQKGKTVTFNDRPDGAINAKAVA